MTKLVKLTSADEKNYGKSIFINPNFIVAYYKVVRQRWWFETLYFSEILVLDTKFKVIETPDEVSLKIQNLFKVQESKTNEVSNIVNNPLDEKQSHVKNKKDHKETTDSFFETNTVAASLIPVGVLIADSIMNNSSSDSSSSDSGD